MNDSKPPKTDSISQLAAFWDSHDLTDFEDELEDAQGHLFVRSEPKHHANHKARFEVYKDNTGMHRFRLKAGNGEIIATGEAYESKNACIRAIESLRVACRAEIFELN